MKPAYRMNNNNNNNIKQTNNRGILEELMYGTDFRGNNKDSEQMFLKSQFSKDERKSGPTKYSKENQQPQKKLKNQFYTDLSLTEEDKQNESLMSNPEAYILGGLLNDSRDSSLLVAESYAFNSNEPRTPPRRSKLRPLELPTTPENNFGATGKIAKYPINESPRLPRSPLHVANSLWKSPKTPSRRSNLDKEFGKLKGSDVLSLQSPAPLSEVNRSFTYRPNVKRNLLTIFEQAGKQQPQKQQQQQQQQPQQDNQFGTWEQQSYNSNNHNNNQIPFEQEQYLYNQQYYMQNNYNNGQYQDQRQYQVQYIDQQQQQFKRPQYKGQQQQHQYGGQQQQFKGNQQQYKGQYQQQYKGNQQQYQNQQQYKVQQQYQNQQQYNGQYQDQDVNKTQYQDPRQYQNQQQYKGQYQNRQYNNGQFEREKQFLQQQFIRQQQQPKQKQQQKQRSRQQQYPGNFVSPIPQKKKYLQTKNVESKGQDDEVHYDKEEASNEIRKVEMTPPRVSRQGKRYSKTPGRDSFKLAPRTPKQTRTPRSFSSKFTPQKDMNPLARHPNREKLNSQKFQHLYHEFHNESAESKAKFKELYREFRNKEKLGYEEASKFAKECLQNYSKDLHWRVAMELANLSKRQHKLEKARCWYTKVNELQPFATQGWLEHAKLEEECGELVQCGKIMNLGLFFCPYNESLLVKTLKHEERQGNLGKARMILSSLKHVNVDKVWRTVLEGALLESRAGNIKVARNIFKYLMKHVSWYGPVYYEASKFEEKQEEYERALIIVEKGLEEVPRYGPLWFSAFQLHRRLHKDDIDVLRKVISRAMKNISSELIWKVYFEAAQIEEKSNNVMESRSMYAQSVYSCPKNLRWKVWISGAIMESQAKNIEVARILLNKAMEEVPKKMRAMVLLECSRLEEQAGFPDSARAILKRAKKETKYEWKVFLESVLLEIREDNIKAAIVECEEALKIHSGTGRLWAILIQLVQTQGDEEQMKIFKRAIKEVPKSGEVWCEGGRIALNPTSPNFNLKSGKKYLEFAMQFTPQYGDSFIEYLRLHMILNGCDSSYKNEEIIRLQNCNPNYGAMWFYCKPHELSTPTEVLRSAKTIIYKELTEFKSLYQRAILRNWYNGKDSNKVDSKLVDIKQEEKKLFYRKCKYIF